MNFILNYIDMLANGSSADSGANNTTSIWVYVVLIVLIILMLVLPMITQRKRNKEYTEMLDSLCVGDTIKTIGGIIGRVTKIQEKDGAKSFILETGAKGTKTTMEFDIASVAYILKSTAKKVEEPKVEEAEVKEVEEQEKLEETAENTNKVEQVEEKVQPKKTAAKKKTQKTSK